LLLIRWAASTYSLAAHQGRESGQECQGSC
jgi:hypothetical protein